MKDSTLNKVTWRLLAVLHFGIIVFHGGLSAQERLRLVQADILESRTISGKSIQFLKGDVIFTKGDMTLKCQAAEYDKARDWGMLTGTVEILSDKWTLTSDRVEYNGSLDAITARSNARIWDDDYNLRADTITYFTELDSGFARGHAKLDQTSQVITANELTYVKVPGDSAVSYTAIGNVMIVDAKRLATCGKAVYHYSGERTLLLENPVVNEVGRVISGSEIQLQYRDEVLQHLYIPSDAFVEDITTKKGRKFRDMMKSRELEGTFSDGKLTGLSLRKMATTVYHVFEDSVYQGENTISGDVILFVFEDGEVIELDVSGGSKGKYAPEIQDTTGNGPVTYAANRIKHVVDSENSFLYGKASIQRGNMNLTSGFIVVDWASNLVNAYQKADEDSLNSPLKPTLRETGREPMSGDQLTFNMKTKKGKVVKGKTKTPEGIYYGKEIRNAEDDVFFVENSLFTTCENEDPHFHFKSRRMKIIQNDKVIARPLFLYIQKIPVFGVPFAIFPHQTGKRHSGWIMPSYGESQNRGQFIDGLGYYWAPSEYWDTRFLLSFADRQGIFAKTLNRYNVRYKFSGNINLEFRRSLSGVEQDIMQIVNSNKTDYVAKWNHSQIMRNKQSLRVSAQYFSNGEYNRNTGLNPIDRLNQQAISNATYSKSWPSLNSSMSINMSSQRDLMAEKKVDSSSTFYVAPYRATSKISVTNSTLPSIGFRKGQTKLIKSQSGKQRWFNQISWNYSSSFNSKQIQFYKAEEFLREDSTTGYRWQGEYNNDGDFEGNINTEYDNLMSHSMSIQSPQKWFRYISVNPSVSLKSDWVDRYNQGYVENGTVKSREVKGFAAQTTGSFRLNTKTQIYGLFPARIGNLRAIRHTMSPTIGFSYTPDFSRDVFGVDLKYFETFTDSLGKEIAVDKFKGTNAGSTPSREQKNINLGLNNVFQAKLLKDDKDFKRDLFSWNMSTSYNHVAEEFKWSNLRSSIRTSLSKKLRFDLSMTHDFYAFDTETNKRVPELRFGSNNLPNPRLVNARISTSFSLEGKNIMARPGANVTESAASDTSEFEPEDYLPGFRKPTFTSGGASWSTRVSLSYSLSKPAPTLERKTFWMNTNTSLKISNNWSLNHSARFDLNRMDIINQSFSINRDLHCWEMAISWTPSGYGQGFYLRINVKSPNLRDLKVEKKGGMFQSRANF